MIEQSGVRIESSGYEIISASEVRPLRDWLLLKPLPWKPSRTIQIAGDTRRTLRGLVVSAGPGVYPKRYNRDRSKTWDSPAFRETACKVGDTVELGGLQFEGYSWFKLLVNGEPHIMVRDEDVCAIVESAIVPRETLENIQAVYS